MARSPALFNSLIYMPITITYRDFLKPLDQGWTEWEFLTLLDQEWTEEGAPCKLHSVHQAARRRSAHQRAVGEGRLHWLLSLLNGYLGLLIIWLLNFYFTNHMVFSIVLI